jgi:glycosyltransferase involved in cell wall biosynthesis
MTGPGAARVAIVIPTFNSVRTLGGAVRSALAQDYPSTRVIVVDDGSVDATRALLDGFPSVTVLRQPNGGPASARNRGWREAAGSEFVFFLDADCVAPPDWVSRLLPFHEEEGTGCVGTVYGLANPGSLLARTVYREFVRRYEFCGDHPSFVGTHGCSFRRAVLEELGGFDESYRRASHEDNDLSWRILRSSRRLRLVRTVAVHHHFPENLRSYLRTQGRHGYWRMKCLRAHPAGIAGDDYSNLCDYLQPPLLVAGTALLLAWASSSAAGEAGLAAIGAAVALQAPVLAGMGPVGSPAGERLFYALLLGPSRALARGIGMLAGVARFWIPVRFSGKG